MTLNTHIYVHDRIDHRELFTECGRLIGINEGTKISDRGGTLMTDPGQGLPGWLMVRYAPGRAVQPKPEGHDGDCEPDCDYQHEPAHWANVSLDTAYSYSDQFGGCGDMHARFVAALGGWLAKRKISWSWRNEFTGEIHQGTDGLSELGHGGEDAAQWMRSTVLPTIATQFRR